MTTDSKQPVDGAGAVFELCPTDQPDSLWRLGAFAVSLESLAEDLREVAEDLEGGAVEIRHPERLPQRKQ